jgi:hypothetical protein
MSRVPSRCTSGTLNWLADSPRPLPPGLLGTTWVCWKTVSAGLAVGTLSVEASWIGQ